MIVIRIIIIRFYRFCVTKFNHEYSHNSNSRTRIIVSYHFVYCFPAFLLFHPLFLLFSHQFLFFYIFSQIFSLFSYFFFFFSACIKCDVQWFVANAMANKKSVMWCQRCHRGQIKLRFAKHEEKVWIGWTAFLFTVLKIHT